MVKLCGDKRLFFYQEKYGKIMILEQVTFRVSYGQIFLF